MIENPEMIYENELIYLIESINHSINLWYTVNIQGNVHPNSE